MKHPLFSILTPSFHPQREQLLGCIASVRGQADVLDGHAVPLEHHVQDGDPSSETPKLLARHEAASRGHPHYHFQYGSGTDHGMYDALNKSFLATQGSLIGHLNSDEQYLPGTLAKARDWFSAHPETDVLFGGVIVIRPDGNYVCSRIPMIPSRWHTRLCHLATFTAAMFYRRSAIERLGSYFDAGFRCAGDADLVLRMLDAGLRMGVLRENLALFADSGHNLALGPKAREESARLAAGIPCLPGARALAAGAHRLRKWRRGAYAIGAVEYEFFKGGTSQTFRVGRGTGRWKRTSPSP
jgi:GT2 family glycosyltransferase